MSDPNGLIDIIDTWGFINDIKFYTRVDLGTCHWVTRIFVAIRPNKSEVNKYLQSYSNFMPNDPRGKSLSLSIMPYADAINSISYPNNTYYL